MVCYLFLSKTYNPVCNAGSLVESLPALHTGLGLHYSIYIGFLTGNSSGSLDSNRDGGGENGLLDMCPQSSKVGKARIMW